MRGSVRSAPAAATVVAAAVQGQRHWRATGAATQVVVPADAVLEAGVGEVLAVVSAAKVSLGSAPASPAETAPRMIAAGGAHTLRRASRPPRGSQASERPREGRRTRTVMAWVKALRRSAGT